jgi:hypothetical protein
MTTLCGSCHCGDLRIVFITDLHPQDVIRRTCDCAFCSKHGVSYVSDPEGRISLFASHPGMVWTYRQGSNLAEFLSCTACAVLVAATYRHPNGLYGAINANCLDQSPQLGECVPTHPTPQTAEEKRSRWQSLWTPDVEIAFLSNSS